MEPLSKLWWSGMNLPSYLAQILLSFGLWGQLWACWGVRDVLQITNRQLQVCYKVLGGWAHPPRRQGEMGHFVLLVGARRHHQRFLTVNDTSLHWIFSTKNTLVCQGKVIVVLWPTGWRCFVRECVCIKHNPALQSASFVPVACGGHMMALLCMFLPFFLFSSFFGKAHINLLLPD